MNENDHALRCVMCIADLRRTMGGSSRSVPQLCDALARANVSTKLVSAIDSTDDLVLPSSAVEFLDVGRRRMPSRIRQAIDRCIVSESAARLVIVHDNGIWRPYHHYVTHAAMRHRLPLLWSPRGALSSWAIHHKNTKKQLAWLLYQRRGLMATTVFHATSDLEADEIRKLGFRQPIAVVPNGIELPDASPSSKLRRGDQRTMLFLSRIHPKKGLINLLHAWKAAAPGPEWSLVIAGPDEGGHQDEVEALAGALQLGRQVEFPGEIGDGDKWRLYESADAFVLPSHSENFGLVVAEALACGTPVLTTTATPWRALVEREMGWWVAPSVEGLASAIRQATSMAPEHLHRFGERAMPWARLQFSWGSIAVRMKLLYEWMAGLGEKPEFVQTQPPGSGSPLLRLRY